MRYTITAIAALVAAPATFGATSAQAAVLVEYNFTGQPGTQASVAASNVDANLTGLDFTRGPGLGANAGSGSINSNGWSTNANVDYYSFGFDVASGYTAGVTGVTFGSQRSGTGPTTINLLYSIDGGAFQELQTFNATTNTTTQSFTWTNALTALSRIEFRLTADVAGTSTNGTYRVTNANTGPAAISGTVSAIAAPVPEPATWALMILGFGAVGYAMRRRAPARSQLA